MTEYPDLFDPVANRAFARNTDPETSHDAADALDGKALTRLESIVVATLADHPAGLTITEIASLADIEAQTISPRMAPLSGAGRIVDSGERRIPEGRSKRAIVWMVAPPGTVPPGRRPRARKPTLESAVGARVYDRITELMDASAKAGTPAGDELAALAALVADVEEYGFGLDPANGGKEAG